MIGFRFGLAAALCAAAATPALAQMPAPYPPAGPDAACLCLKQAVDATHAEMAARQNDFSASQANLNQLDGQLAAARAREDVANPASVAQFRQLLEQRDAAFRQSNGSLLAASQAATARYNDAVAAYNNQCAGRPLPPPPPGPLACPAMR